MKGKEVEEIILVFRNGNSIKVPFQCSWFNLKDYSGLLFTITPDLEYIRVHSNYTWNEYSRLDWYREIANRAYWTQERK